jgi:hypothetical protein
VALALLCSVVALDVTPAASAAGAKLLGPLLSRKETPNTSWARDGGLSVALPNGKEFWIFGDAPRYEWKNGAWRMTGFIYGSTAAQRTLKPGKPLSGPLSEVWVGHPQRPTNPVAQFLPLPSLYMPDGSGRRCNKKNGGSAVEAVRWATGAALMPDRTNILIPYVEVCVLGAAGHWAQGWGFTLYNYKTNRFSQKPYAVFPPSSDGATIPTNHMFGTPIIKNGRITFFSWECCTPGQSVHTTTINATVGALKKRASYKPKPVPDLPATFLINVAPPSKTHPKITMYVLTGTKGEYEIYAASKAQGPWSRVASGQLPGCPESPRRCRSFALHPEISPAKRLVVSYYLHGFGPGIPTKHPAPEQRLPHTVLASIPCAC